MDLYKMSLRPTSPTRPVTPDCPRSRHYFKLGVWQKLQNFFVRDGSQHGMESDNDTVWSKLDQEKLPNKCGTSSARPVGIGLPRQATFKRQNSEKRDRLCLVEPLPDERRAFSASRTGPNKLIKFRSNSVPSTSMPSRQSAPAIGNTCAIDGSSRHSFDVSPSDDPPADAEQSVEYDRMRPPRPASITSSTDSYDDQRDHFEDRAQLNRELDTKWILNLSMHFRDKSDREKFFVTYAETPTRWRRVTVSCDYRGAEVGSLEMDLKELQLQRDKSMQIYEAIRDSLLKIKFYDTVTNLKLETSDRRLHVHVTEDVNEIIPYPPISNLQHIFSDSVYQSKQICESELSFEAHLSGFVYKVMYKGKPYIKKEIPGPDTVDEFLYEVNALHALQDSRCVIDLEAIITDDSGQLIKGLLINYAEQGAVVDLLYDQKGEISWELRERWARHAMQGLSQIHEEGYVQGDFTLSNIVVDRDDNARIIDINRRGCPVGWEPPEIAKKIASNQRISMYIGEKSDLYQLGMTLWALAMDDDEPERHDPPLSTQKFPAEVPDWYREIVRNCLAWRPRDRLKASDLLKLIPPEQPALLQSSQNSRPSVRIRSDKRYIDPATAVERDDLERYRDWDELDEAHYSPESSREDYTFTWPQSSDYDRDYDTSSSRIERPRGRRRVSDHDLELQAQRRRERALINDVGAEVDNHQHGSVPIISISGDGTESHVVDDSDGEPPIEVVRSDQDEDRRTTMTSSISPQLSSLQQVPDGLLFPSYSETSEDTPRNSSFQLFDTGDDTSDPTYHMRREPVPNTFAGLGSHVDTNEHSINHTQFQTEGNEDDHVPAPAASMPFNDSGYNDPLTFGIEPEEQSYASKLTEWNAIGAEGQSIKEDADRRVLEQTILDFRPQELARTPETNGTEKAGMEGPGSESIDIDDHCNDEYVDRIYVKDLGARDEALEIDLETENLIDRIVTNNAGTDARPSILDVLKAVDAQDFTPHNDCAELEASENDIEIKETNPTTIPAFTDRIGPRGSVPPTVSVEVLLNMFDGKTTDLENIQHNAMTVEPISTKAPEPTAEEVPHGIISSDTMMDDKAEDIHCEREESDTQTYGDDRTSTTDIETGNRVGHSDKLKEPC